MKSKSSLLASAQSSVKDTRQFRSISIQNIDIDKIKDFNQQPRKYTDNDEYRQEIKLLADDIRRNNLINPITVAQIRDHIDDPNHEKTPEYMLIAGSRRLAAFRHIKANKIPANVYIVDKHQDDLDKYLFLISDAENNKREDLSAIENAEAIHHMNNKLGMSIDEIAEIRNITISQIYRYLRIVKYKIQIIDILKNYKIDINTVKSLRFLTALQTAIAKKDNDKCKSIIEKYLQEELETNKENDIIDTHEETTKKAPSTKPTRVIKSYAGNIIVDMKHPHKLVIDTRKAEQKEFMDVINGILNSTIKYGSVKDFGPFVDYLIDNKDTISDEIMNLFEEKHRRWGQKNEIDNNLN